MRCSCGRELSDRANFCPNCRKPVVREVDAKCSYCGAVAKPGAKYCNICGREIIPSVVLPKPPVPPIDPPIINPPINGSPNESAESEFFRPMSGL